MYLQQVTVWSGFRTAEVVGPYLFEDDNGNAVTVNDKRYRHIITEFLWSAFVGINLDEICFQ